MSYALQLSELAEADLAEAADWYRRIRPGLGDELLLCVEQTINRILDNPNSFPVVRHDARRALVRRFPYSVVFRVRGNRVEVEAVFHGSKDPVRLRDRIG
jgi:plasmid stabilization system protein ParE